MNTTGNTAGGVSGSGPLSGIRVLEFGQIYAGPLAGLVLADLGAEVVKIEPPAGDGMRAWPPFFEKHPDGSGHPQVSLSFGTVNRGKKSLSLNLKDPGDVETVRALIGECDVVLENFRPGAMSRLGLGFDEVAKVNPEIVYCSLSGFGQTGPERMQGAFDVVVQGYSGLMSVTGESAERPVKCGVPVADAVPGLYAALSIVAAIAGRSAKATAVRKSLSGPDSDVSSKPRAVYLDCSMLDSLLAISGLQLAQFFATGVPPVPLGTAHPSNAPYQMFHANDGAFILAAGNQALWRKVCDALSDGELRDDPRFATQLSRVQNQTALERLLNEHFRRQTTAHWLERFSDLGVPAGPVNNFAQVVESPQVVERRVIVPFTLECGCQGAGPVFPVKSNAATLPSEEWHYRVPKLGGDKSEILSRWLGENDPRRDLSCR